MREGVQFDQLINSSDATLKKRQNALSLAEFAKVEVKLPCK